MYGIGGNQQLGGQDGLFGGLQVKKGAGALDLLISGGQAIVGQAVYSREATDEATVVNCPTTAGTHTVYLNAAGAKDADGNALARITVDTKEADKTRDAVNGSKSVRLGRSLVLATVTVASNAITAVDNGARMKNYAAPHSLAI